MPWLRDCPQPDTVDGRRVVSKKPPPRPAVPSSPPSPLGHNYCWVEHKKTGARCIHPRGHEQQGVDHHDPYASPPISWP